jgi:Fe-S cluster biogenesis protein NfuA/nitrite reductase/ring-hydroxylating ferredoxin subunit
VDDRESRERVGRVEALLDEVDSLSDPAAREKALEVVQALLDLYGEGLGRIVEHVAAGDDGRLAEALAGDELVAHLLLLHGLHPVPVEARVRGALEEVRPYLESHGGNVELLAVEEGAVRLALQGSCSGCPSSAMTLKLAIEDAIHKAAPEIDEVIADGALDSEPAPALLQLEVLGGPAQAQAPPPTGDGGGGWAMAGGLPQLSGGGSLVTEVAGERVLFLRLGEDLYAYRPSCPSCEASLEAAGLSGAELACPGCGNRYDARRAGRCLDDAELHLEPLPLLHDEAGLVKVALGAPA